MFKSEFLTFFIKTYPWEFPWLGLLASTGGDMDLILGKEIKISQAMQPKKKKELPKSIVTLSSIFVNVYSFPLVSQIKSLGRLSSPIQYMISHCVLWMIQPSEHVQSSVTVHRFYCSHLFPDTPIFWIVAESTDRTSCCHSHLPTHTDAVSAARVKLGDSRYFPA